VRTLEACKRCNQPRSSLVKVENGDLHADSHNILSKWKNYLSYIFNVYNVSDVRQAKIHSAQPLVPDRSPFDLKIAVARKSVNFPGNDSIPEEGIQARGETLQCETHKVIYQFTRSIIRQIKLRR
jgi:hypothetical protein